MRSSDACCRILLVAVLAAATTTPSVAAKLTDKEHTRIEVSRPAGVPDDAALEAAGAVIGTVDIDVRNIFDANDPRESNGLYHLANKLHHRTKHSTIRAQLLFAADQHGAVTRECAEAVLVVGDHFSRCF